MKPRNAQSALLFMTGDAPRTPVRTWLVQCPPGMLANGASVRRFTGVDAFDGYVREVRAQGYTVTFNSPFTATVEARQ